MRIFPKLKGMVSTGKACFEIAQHGVDPPELRQVPGFAATGDDHIMLTSSIAYAIETTQAIGQYAAARIKGITSPVLNGFTGKHGNRDKFSIDGMPLIIYGNCGDKRDLVFRSSPGLATRILTAQISIIRLCRALKRLKGFALQHGLHALVLDTPGREVADPQLALQRQCGQTRLGLTDQVNGEKPSSQGQAGALENGAGNQRSLVTTMAALKRLARTAFQNRMLGTVALGAMKSFRPAGQFQGRSALLFGAKTLYEFGERQPLLKLHTIHRHRTSLSHNNQCIISQRRIELKTQRNHRANQEEL